MMKCSSWIKSALGSVVLAAVLPACASADYGDANASAMAAPVSMVLSDIDGKQHDLNQVLSGGVPVALVFWQSW